MSFNHRTFLTAVEESLAQLQKHPKLKELLADRTGGVVCVCSNEGGMFLLSSIGQLTSTNEMRYRGFCIEKASRLARNKSHDLSRESRNLLKHQYAGAIRAGGYILSFSGLPEELDELLMFMTAVKTGLMSKEIARDRFYHFPTQYAQANENDIWHID